MRARGLKPSLFKNELLATSDPLNTLIFEGLWCLADRAGRLEDRPRRIHLEINPGRAFEGTEAALAWLAEEGFIVRYEVDGQAYIQVVNFEKHQHPHHREPESIIPEPEASPGKAQGEPEAGPSTARLTPDSGLLTTSSSKKARAKPDWQSVENLDQDAWADWLAFRRAEGMPAYKTTQSAQALARYPPEVQRAAIEHSKANRYQGLFPDKANGTGKQSRKPSAVERAQRATGGGF